MRPLCSWPKRKVQGVFLPIFMHQSHSALVRSGLFFFFSNTYDDENIGEGNEEGERNKSGF